MITKFGTKYMIEVALVQFGAIHHIAGGLDRKIIHSPGCESLRPLALLIDQVTS